MQIDTDIIRKSVRESLSELLKTPSLTTKSIQCWLEEEIASTLSKYIKRDVDIRLQVSHEPDSSELFNIRVIVSEENEFKV